MSFSWGWLNIYSRVVINLPCDKRSPYPVPNIEIHKRNHKENCRPSILTCDNEDTEYCNVHCSSNSYEEGDEHINVRLII